MPIDPQRFRGAAGPSGTNQPIGQWKESDLLRWFQGVARGSKTTVPSKHQVVDVYDKLTVRNKIQLSPQAAAYILDTTGAATTTFVDTAVAARTPLITSSDVSSGTPASPSDGDIWIATGVDSNGTAWQFRYNASSASTYKWEFIGGSPLSTSWAGGPQSNTVASTWQPWTSPGFLTAPLAGDYMLQVQGTVFVSAPAAQAEGLMACCTYNTGTTLGADTITFTHPTSGTLTTEMNPVSIPWRATLTAGHQVGIATWSNPIADCLYYNPFWQIVPTRVA